MSNDAGDLKANSVAVNNHRYSEQPFMTGKGIAVQQWIMRSQILRREPGICLVMAVSLSVGQSAVTAQNSLAKGAGEIGLPRPDRRLVYRKLDEPPLSLHVFESGDRKTSNRPAIVFFFGGGWRSGSPAQFYPHCRHLADQGMVAVAAEYRTNSSHGTTPFECVTDGKSALRFVRKNAAMLGIDPQRIAAGGGSAGGHVAAAVATVPGLDHPSDDTSISCRPNALVLFNPVYDNGPGEYGHDRVADRFREISPRHNISDRMPPAIVFFGTKDKLVPVSTAESFQQEMIRVGVRSELRLYKDQTHGFFNLKAHGGEYYRKTVAEMDIFLRSLGYLSDEPMDGQP